MQDLPEDEPGSSPRVRGKPTRPVPSRQIRRLIPARAGKTLPRSGVMPRMRAHPRVCGENSGVGDAWWNFRGSSPRVRGKPRDRAAPVRQDGLIPARAGKTSRWRLIRRARGAHPRACGENTCFATSTCPTSGSSPRVRGKLGHDLLGDKADGLIPARAGKTAHTPVSVYHGWAHPRACGENLVRVCKKQLAAGSSPRVRGKLIIVDRGDHRVGLIPARAGKTIKDVRSEARIPAHPRACGENQRTLRYPRHQAGSSPRVRGKRGMGGASSAGLRLIPARAGKTF